VAKPASQRAGRSTAESGRLRYSWTTVRPARAPVLRTVTAAWTGSPPGAAAGASIDS
jgi:hypothetical protein